MAKKRELTRFICREMLYDYLTEVLDEGRKRAVEEFLVNDAELTQELEAMRDAISYCDKLGETKIAQQGIRELSEVKPSAEKILNRLAWRSWPDGLRWSVQAFVISASVAFMAMVLPWENISNFLPSHEDKAQFVQLPPLENTENDLSEEPVTEEPSPSDTEVSETTAESAPVAPTTPATPTPPPRASSPQGLLYRIMMSHENTQNITPEIKDKILSLNGEKAGQVELGWRKPNGNYFHFSLPDKNYEDFLDNLSQFGQTRIYKNPHQRVMPEGVIRIILWIEERPSKESNGKESQGEESNISEESPPPDDTDAGE